MSAIASSTMASAPQTSSPARRQRSSYIPLAYEASRQHDQYQNQQDVGNDRCGGRHFDRIEIVQRRRSRDGDPRCAQSVEQRVVRSEERRVRKECRYRDGGGGRKEEIE